MKKHRTNIARKVAKAFLFISVTALSQGLFGATAHAASLPAAKNKQVKITVRNQDLPDLLKAVFGNNQIPVVISPQVTGNISGNFNQPLETLLNDFSSSFGFTWFYDGQILYINALSEISSRAVSLSSNKFDRMRTLLKDLHLDEPRFSIRWMSQENSLLVAGPPRYLSAVEELAQLVDSSQENKQSPMTAKVYRLQHAWAKDIKNGQVGTTIPGVASLLKNIMKVRQNAQLPEAIAATTNAQSVKPVDSAVAVTPVGGQTAPGSASRVPAEDDNPQNNEPRIEADPRINAVIVRDTWARMAMYDKLIKQLDVKNDLVEIEATVIDLDAENTEKIGVNLRAFNEEHHDFASGSAATANNAGANLGAVANTFNDTPAGLVTSIVFGSSRRYFSATLDALIRKGDATIDTRPRVLTLDNTEAVLENQQDFFVRVAGQYTANLYRLEAGLTMLVTPQIIKENGVEKIKLLVTIEDGSISNIAQVDQIPVVSRKRINTQAVINAGDSLLIGGYIVDETTVDNSKVPLLGDIPVLGRLFQHKSEKKRRIERMIMITPRLVNP